MNNSFLLRLFLQFSVFLTMASKDLLQEPQVMDMAVSNTHFTFDLLRQCGAEKKGEDVFFAPYSITTALAMTCTGARGSTAQEMMRVLKWPSATIPSRGFGSYLPLLNEAAAGETPGYILVGAQRIYVRGSMSVKTDFLSATKQDFASQAMEADFAGNPDGERVKINSWVKEQTREKISDLLPPGSIDPLTAMVLVQAIYFKGNWKHKFDTKKTHPADFFTSQGKPVKVNMMEQTEKFNYGVSDKLDCAAVELPYASNKGSDKEHDLSMLILLPNARDGLEKLESSLTYDGLKEIQRGMRSVKVNLKLPRFSVESSFALKKVLSSLGMPQAFGPRADFSGMADAELSISEVFHKAVVEVNEEGSEAAAATGVVMMMRSMPIIEPFIADHPFLFFIVDKRADVILFSGRLVNPPAVAASQQKQDL